MQHYWLMHQLYSQSSFSVPYFMLFTYIGLTGMPELPCRAVLGSVSDYCSHHAHCTVMIVKKPKHKH